MVSYMHFINEANSDIAVLILVIVDNGLVHDEYEAWDTADTIVLILVIVDNGLVHAMLIRLMVVQHWMS